MVMNQVPPRASGTVWHGALLKLDSLQTSKNMFEKNKKLSLFNGSNLLLGSEKGFLVNMKVFWSKNESQR